MSSSSLPPSFIFTDNGVPITQYPPNVTSETYIDIQVNHYYYDHNSFFPPHHHHHHHHHHHNLMAPAPFYDHNSFFPPHHQNPMDMAMPPYGMIPNDSPPLLEHVDEVLILDPHLGVPTTIIRNHYVMVDEPASVPQDYLVLPEGIEEQDYLVLLEEMETHVNNTTSTRGLSKEVISKHLPRAKVMKRIQRDSSDEEGAEVCAVCQDEYEDDQEVGVLKCSHYYHSRCIGEWLLQQNVCPVCRCKALDV